ncbi:MAG: hypothetical protein SV775_11395 [Thermodesulfobacteriota bacterium]|nr:hypothetical protein [Thermodesulfobacteriota bacterium]
MPVIKKLSKIRSRPSLVKKSMDTRLDSRPRTTSEKRIFNNMTIKAFRSSFGYIRRDTPTFSPSSIPESTGYEIA